MARGRDRLDALSYTVARTVLLQFCAGAQW